MAKKNQKFGDSGSLAQEMETGFVFNRMPSEPPLTLFAEDSPASLFPQQESERVRETTVFSGRKCYELYGRFTHLGCLAKMLLESSIWHSNKCVLTWKAKVMKSNRLLFQLAPSTPRTEGIASGLLRTPRTMEVEESQEKFVNRMGDRTMACTSGLSMQIAMLPTPKTPTGGGLKQPRTTLGGGDRKLEDKFAQIGTKTGIRLRLEPAFALWMMGFPEDWCSLKDGE